MGTRFGTGVKITRASSRELESSRGKNSKYSSHENAKCRRGIVGDEPSMAIRAVLFRILLTDPSTL